MPDCIIFGIFDIAIQIVFPSIVILYLVLYRNSSVKATLIECANSKLDTVAIALRKTNRY